MSPGMPWESGVTGSAAKHARTAYLLALASGALAIGVGFLRRALPISSAVAFLAAVLPLLPLVGFIVYVFKMVRALDELQRLIHLEALMLQFGATAITVMGYGMLARAGLLPNVTLVEAYPYLWIALFLYWGIGLVVVRRRYR